MSVSTNICCSLAVSKPLRVLGELRSPEALQCPALMTLGANMIEIIIQTFDSGSASKQFPNKGMLT